MRRLLLALAVAVPLGYPAPASAQWVWLDPAWSVTPSVTYFGPPPPPTYGTGSATFGNPAADNFTGFLSASATNPPGPEGVSVTARLVASRSFRVDTAEVLTLSAPTAGTMRAGDYPGGTDVYLSGTFRIEGSPVSLSVTRLVHSPSSESFSMTPTGSAVLPPGAYTVRADVALNASSSSGGPFASGNVTTGVGLSVTQRLVFWDPYGTPAGPLSTGQTFTGGTPPTTYTVSSTTPTGPAGGTATVTTAGQLRLNTGGTQGLTAVTAPTASYAAPYRPTLSENAAQSINWSFNLQRSSSGPVGFDPGESGAAVVLGATSADLRTASGYAVVLGSSESGELRLVRFTGGLDADAKLTTVAGFWSNIGATFLSVKVRLDPATDTWTLAARGEWSFADPLANEDGFTTSSPAADATFTGVELSHFGFVWNHGAGVLDAATFDNFVVTLTPVPEPAAVLRLAAAGMLVALAGIRRPRSGRASRRAPRESTRTLQPLGACNRVSSTLQPSSPTAHPVTPSAHPSTHHPTGTLRPGTQSTAAFMPLVPDASCGLSGVFTRTGRPSTATMTRAGTDSSRDSGDQGAGDSDWLPRASRCWRK